MDKLAPACDCGDDEAVARVLDETFIFGAWGHRLSAPEGTIEDGELRLLRANIRRLVVGAYRWNRPPRAVVPTSRDAYEWVHFRVPSKSESLVSAHPAVCGLTAPYGGAPYDEVMEPPLFVRQGKVDEVNCPECLRWLIDYLVSQLALVERQP